MPLTIYKWQSEPGPQVVDEEHVVNIIVHCVYDLTQKSVHKSLAHLHVIITNIEHTVHTGGRKCNRDYCACAVDVRPYTAVQVRRHRLQAGHSAVLLDLISTVRKKQKVDLAVYVSARLCLHECSQMPSPLPEIMRVGPETNR